MRKSKRPMLTILKRRNPLRVGFLPENDCAPVVVAKELGFFERYGLSVELHSQASWKHIHTRLMNRELDAAHAPAMLPFLINLGLTPEKYDCVTGLVLSLQGNAITVSKELWRLGVRDAVTLRELIWQDRKKKIYTIGVTCPLGTQYALLCDWLRSVKEPPYTEVRIESVPPEQLFPLLKLGYLDGYCAGEPWNSVAVQAGAGACVATSATMAPLHPEKIFMARKDFAVERADEYERMIAALIEACHFCDQSENRRLVCTMLAQARYVNAPVECVEPGLIGPFGLEGSKVPSLHGLNIFHRNRANEPTATKAAWLTGRLFGFLRWDVRPAALNGVFRRDIFKRAWRLLPKDAGSRTAQPGQRFEGEIEAESGQVDVN